MQMQSDINSGFLTLKLESGLLHEYSDGKFTTVIFGFTPNSEIELPKDYTHFEVEVILTKYKDKLYTPH